MAKIQFTDEQKQQLRDWKKHIPDKRKGALRRRWQTAIDRKSMKAAIVAKCQDCMNYQEAEVRDCEIITCPLWQYRPYQRRKQKGAI